MSPHKLVRVWEFIPRNPICYERKMLEMCFSNAGVTSAKLQLPFVFFLLVAAPTSASLVSVSRSSRQVNQTSTQCLECNFFFLPQIFPA